MTTSYPLISCICISQYDVATVKYAIKNFEKQNYPNKELVISFSKNNSSTLEFLSGLHQVTDLRVVFLPRDPKEPLKNSKFNSILKSSGTYICYWNEEDWFHESRLSFQYNSMQIVGEKYRASVFSKITIYDPILKKSYPSKQGLWPKTILCSKDSILSDRDLIDEEVLTKSLNAKKQLYLFDNAPFLYSSRLDLTQSDK